MTTAAPQGITRTCWFEVNIGPMKESIQRGFPDRIRTSSDPKWELIREKFPMSRGRIIVADVMFVGDEIYPRQFVPETLLQMAWEQGRDALKKFEQDSRLWDNTLSDQVNADKLKAESERVALATAIADAITSPAVQAAAGSKS